MRFFSILVLLFLQNSVFASAQRGASEPEGNKTPDIVKSPDNVSPNEQTGSGGSEGAGNNAKANDRYNVPGAIDTGKNPKPAAEEDNGADIEEIGEKLKDLIEKIVDVIKDAVDSDGSTTTTTSVRPLPAAAGPCSSALDAYSTCSAANSNFSALPKTQQAGCLCNAYQNFDFNGDMQSCYSYAQNRTQYQTYATAVASGTALCACDPDVVMPTDIYGNGNANPCKTSSPAATTTPAPSPTPAVATPTTQPPTGAASRSYGISVAATLSVLAILMTLL